MKRSRLILALSVLLNVILLGTLAARELHFRIQQFQWEWEAPSWARFAGSMQAHADFGNGVRRFYRPTLTASTEDRPGFTGERDREAEIWPWSYYPESSEASRAAAVSFTDAYNKRMREYIADPASYKPNGLAATRASD